MVSTFNVQNIEKLNGNNLHTWKMKMEFFLHEKDLWEIIGTKKNLPPKVEFFKKILEGGTFEHICS
jgi:hypothetical protein